jgi:hypothetical protein
VCDRFRCEERGCVPKFILLNMSKGMTDDLGIVMMRKMFKGVSRNKIRAFECLSSFVEDETT